MKACERIENMRERRGGCEKGIIERRRLEEQQEQEQQQQQQHQPITTKKASFMSVPNEGRKRED